MHRPSERSGNQAEKSTTNIAKEVENYTQRMKTGVVCEQTKISSRRLINIVPVIEDDEIHREDIL